MRLILTYRVITIFLLNLLRKLFISNIIVLFVELEITDRAENLARFSLNIGAIKLHPEKPFLWASGYYMPIYNDNRMLLASCGHRQYIRDTFHEFAKYDLVGFEVIAGTSTAGIPHATSLADKMNLPLIYVREKAKDHGMKNRIEGIDADEDLGGRRVLLIEDLISTGGSSASAVDAIRQAKGAIDTCYSIFDYGFVEANAIFDGNLDYKSGGRLNMPCRKRSILSYDTLLRVAQEEGKIKQEQLATLQDWRIAPFAWGRNHGFPPQLKK